MILSCTWITGFLASLTSFLAPLLGKEGISVSATKLTNHIRSEMEKFQFGEIWRGHVSRNLLHDVIYIEEGAFKEIRHIERVVCIVVHVAS